MVKKKKAASVTKRIGKKEAFSSSFFMGLSKSQTQSLAIGSIIVGLGLFALTTFTVKNKAQWQANVFPTAAVSPIATISSIQMTSTMSATPTVTKMISATSTAKMADKMPIVKKLPNTTSKVTYTVEPHDSIAKIGERLCGSERAWLSIVATNNIMYPYTIHPGETYIITCN
jgi:nucleoid-associated protein YgaU